MAVYLVYLHEYGTSCGDRTRIIKAESPEAIKEYFASNMDVGYRGCEEINNVDYDFEI